MSIYTVIWRDLFSQAQPPSKRAADTLDYGESLLTTLSVDSDALDARNTTFQTEKKYSGIKMVMQASLNEIFSETTFEVETVQKTILLRYWFTETEAESASLYRESENTPYYLFTEAEIPAEEASIIVRVPAGLFASNFDQVNERVRILKVAGKSYKLESL